MAITLCDDRHHHRVPTTSSNPRVACVHHRGLLSHCFAVGRRATPTLYAKERVRPKAPIPALPAARRTRRRRVALSAGPLTRFVWPPRRGRHLPEKERGAQGMMLPASLLSLALRDPREQKKETSNRFMRRSEGRKVRCWFWRGG